MWQRLASGQRGPSRRLVIGLWIAAAVVLVLGSGGSLLWYSPLVTPQLTLVSPTTMSDLELDGGTVRVLAVLAHDGYPVTVLDVESAAPGLELRGVAGERPGDPSPFPVTLGGGERVAFLLDLRVADCTAVDVRMPVILQATVTRPWGEMAVNASGMFETSGSEEDLLEVWCRR